MLGNPEHAFLGAWPLGLRAVRRFAPSHPLRVCPVQFGLFTQIHARPQKGSMPRYAITEQEVHRRIANAAKSTLSTSLSFSNTAFAMRLLGDPSFASHCLENSEHDVPSHAVLARERLPAFKPGHNHSAT